MSIQNVRNYFSNTPSKTRHSTARSTPEDHQYQSSISNYSASASLSLLKHSSKLYEEGAITKDFLGFDQTQSTVRHLSTPLSIHSEPLCFSTVHKLDKKWFVNSYSIININVYCLDFCLLGKTDSCHCRYSSYLSVNFMGVHNYVMCCSHHTHICMYVNVYSYHKIIDAVTCRHCSVFWESRLEIMIIVTDFLSWCSLTHLVCVYTFACD